MSWDIYILIKEVYFYSICYTACSSPYLSVFYYVRTSVCYSVFRSDFYFVRYSVSYSVCCSVCWFVCWFGFYHASLLFIIVLAIIVVIAFVTTLRMLFLNIDPVIVHNACQSSYGVPFCLQLWFLRAMSKNKLEILRELSVIVFALLNSYCHCWDHQ